MSGPPWWLAYAWAVSLWVAVGCMGMAVFSACIDRVGRNRPEKRPERP